MLTIRHDERNGHESIQQVKGVSRDEGGLHAFGCENIGGPVDDSGHCYYGNGTVYVMNDRGSTVAVYDLSLGACSPDTPLPRKR